MEKQKNKFEYLFKKKAKHIALILLVSLFASTFLLPISEAQAVPTSAASVPAGYIKTATGLLVPSTAAGTKAAATSAAGKGVTASLFSGTTIGVVVILALVIGAVALAHQFFTYMLKPDPVIYNLNNTFINTGWKMMRDLCNLFFLLALLFIAFCTILQIEKYNAKKNLLTLIIFALLINFSKPISIFIFDGSQLLMNWFLNDANKNGSLPTTLMQFSKVGEVLKNNVWATGLSWDLPVTFLFSIIFIFVFFVVYFCLALFLLIRIVAIWILVIISPFAFFAMILPDFRKMATQWWDALFRYAYVGPAIAFFLWLADRLRALQGQIIGRNMVTADASSSLQNMPVFIPYMITVVFLFAALMMSNQFGIYFAQTITGSANKFMKWAAVNLLKWGERAALMKPITVGGREFTLSPRAWIKGWQEHSAEVDRRSLEQAMAHPRDVLSSIFKRGERPKTYFRDVMFSKLEAEKMKEIESVSTESSYMWDVIQRAKKSKSREAQAAASAALKILFKQNDQDDYMIDGYKKPHDPLEAKKFMEADLLATGLTEREIGKIFFQLGHIALPNGNMGYWGMGSYDKDTKDYKINDEGTQLAKIRAKAQTFETQGLAKVLHRNALMTESADWYEDEDGNKRYHKRTFTEVHRVGKILAEILAQNESALEQFKGRGKVDTLAAAGAPENYRHWETLARTTLQASRDSMKAAAKLHDAAEVLRIQGKTKEFEKAKARVDMKIELSKTLEKNTEIYLKFGETAHAAYSHGKEAKIVQITAPGLAAFKAGDPSVNWREINTAEIKRLEAEAKRLADEEKERAKAAAKGAKADAAAAEASEEETEEKSDDELTNG